MGGLRSCEGWLGYGWVCGLWWGLLLFVVWGWGRGWKEGGREGGGEVIRGCCVIVIVLIYLSFPTKHPSFFLLSHLVSFLPSFLPPLCPSTLYSSHLISSTKIPPPLEKTPIHPSSTATQTHKPHHRARLRDGRTERAGAITYVRTGFSHGKWVSIHESNLIAFALHRTLQQELFRPPIQTSCEPGLLGGVSPPQHGVGYATGRTDGWMEPSP